VAPMISAFVYKKVYSLQLVVKVVLLYNQTVSVLTYYHRCGYKQWEVVEWRIIYRAQA